MKKLLFSILAFGITQVSVAQHGEKCANQKMHKEYIKQNPNAKKTFDQIENQLQKIIQKNYTKRSIDQVYKVPVVIHVMHLGEAEGVGNNISDEQINSGITHINEAFRNTGATGVDTKIEFVLAKQDPNCAASTGIVRYDASGITDYATDGISTGGVGADEVTLKAASKWSNTDYYNIWIVNEISGNDGAFGTQGFAYYPGTSSARDGAVVMNTSWGSTGTVESWKNQSKTAIHELGHGLDLYHTFNTINDGDTVANGCPSDANCATDGDKCCDTDPHKASASFTCTENDINECTGNIYGNVVRNYMDYSDQDCQDMFTQDQMDRMRAALEGPRATLLVSKGLVSPITTFSEPIAASCQPVTQADGLSGGFAGIMNASFHTLNNTTSYAAASRDSGSLNFADDCLLAVYVNPDSTYDLSIESWANTSYAKGWIDYDNDGIFEANELVYDQTHPSKTVQTQAVTIPVSATKNQFLRMRLLLDLNPVTSACMNPQYGQSEDYAVYIQDVHSVSGKIYEEPAGSKSSTCGITGAANLAITLTQNGVIKYSTVTNGLGDYTFNSVTSGTYDVFVDSVGYNNVTAPEVTVIEDRTDVEYVLESSSLNVCNNTIGTNDIDPTTIFTIAPNPALNNFMISVSNLNSSTDLNYRITDIQGRLIQNGLITETNKTIDISNINQGIYSVSVGNENGYSTQQLVKR